MPFIAEPDSEFDAANHIPVEGDREVEAGAKITQTIAMGFTFQGQQIRRAVVALEGSQAADGGTPSPAATEAPEDADETDSQGELL
jgi:hypothetical protein